MISAPLLSFYRGHMPSKSCLKLYLFALLCQFVCDDMMWAITGLWYSDHMWLATASGAAECWVCWVAADTQHRDSVTLGSGGEREGGRHSVATSRCWHYCHHCWTQLTVILGSPTLASTATAQLRGGDNLVTGDSTAAANIVTQHHWPPVSML